MSPRQLDPDLDGAATGADPSREPSAGDDPGGPIAPDLASLPIAGITRRRMAAAVAVLLAVWIVIVFARQASEAQAATGRAGSLVVANLQQRTHLTALERELRQIQQDRYILQQARGYGLGGPKEVAFTLDPDAPPLPADAPGSAAVRVGAPEPVSPLDRWLSILFGEAD